MVRRVKRASLELYTIGDLPAATQSRFGAKAVWLDRLARLGFRVPKAVVIPTEGYWAWRRDREISSALAEQVDIALGFVRTERRRLVAIRSASWLSLPGQLSTAVNVGAEVAEFVDGHSRAPVLWAGVAREVLRRDGHRPEQTTNALAEILSGRYVPRPRSQQIAGAMEDVFRSATRAAAAVHALVGVPFDPGTACIVQAMVHGDADERSAAGVVSTCDPITGASDSTGSFLWASPGSALMDGSGQNERDISELQARVPAAFAELMEAGAAVARDAGYPIELEFVVEQGSLWLLQARAASLSRAALARTLRQSLDCGTADPIDIARKWIPGRRQAGSNASLDRAECVPGAIAHGTPAAGGLAVGRLVWARAGVPAAIGAIVAVDRLEASRDFGLIVDAAGVLTARGGPASHVAALCRKLGKPYICQVAWASEGAPKAVAPFSEGDPIWLDGTSGLIGAGSLPPGTEETDELGLDDITAPLRSWSWFVAHNREENDIAALAGAATDLLSRSRWKAEKARVAELSAFFPLKRRIPFLVASVHEPATIRRAMLDGIASGYLAGPKCAFDGAPRLGTGMWQTGLRTERDIDAFLNDPDYQGVSPHGGFQKWILQPELSELILMFDPPGKQADVPRKQRFIACLSISPSRQFAIVDLLGDTWRMRDFEDARSEDIARIYGPLDRLLAGDPILVADFGAQWMKTREHGERSASLVTVGGDGRFHVVDPRVSADLHDRSASIIATVAAALFGDWWSDPRGLPVIMDVLDRAAGLDVAEFQGRHGAGSADFFLLFDLKGAEEARAWTERKAP